MEQRITQNAEVLQGAPFVAGTRVTVEHVLERLGEGATVEELLEQHPRLTRKGIQAALRFAAAVLRAGLRPVAQNEAR